MQVEEYINAMERIKIKEGIRIVMSISADGNKFLQVMRHGTRGRVGQVEVRWGKQ